MEKVVLITGCSSGIGRALAVECANRGHKVVATARRPETLKDIASDRVLTMALDVNDPTGIAAAISNIEEEAGRIDILVNNAGYGQMGAMLDVSIDQLRDQFETNIMGAMAMIQAVAPGMIERRSGCIVNVGSVSGHLTTPFAGAYCASKAALHCLSDALRMEVAPFGVNVVIVKPGGVTSHIGETAAEKLALPDDSRYSPIRDAILRRAKASQEDAMPAEQVAHDIADAMFAANPPHVVATGTGGRIYPAYKRWIPGPRLDRMLSKRFGLARLEA